MKTLLKSVAIVAALLAGTSGVAMAAPKPAAAAAPVAGNGGVNGVAVANLEAIVANSNAFKAAQAQRPTVYKAQYDAAQTRRAQIEAQLKPLIDKYQKDAAAPGANQASLAQQGQTIQQIQESGRAELQKILEPVALSEAYAQEQVNDKLVQAVQAAMTKNSVTLLLNPQAIISASNAYNLNQAILNELNAVLPSVQVTPPAGWQPREVREQQAQQGAQSNAAAGDGR